MKYTIQGFSQKIATDHQLTCKDLTFFRWLIDFMVTGRMQFEYFEKKLYFWVDNDAVIAELPILNIKDTQNLRRYLRSLVKKGLLEYKLFQGNKPYYKANPKVANLLISAPNTQRRKK
jgi:hypothetical protein